MARICVVGAGTAGTEAAFEASAGGAEVTVVDRADRPAPPWRSWPDLIRAASDSEDSALTPWYRGRRVPALTLTAVAKSARQGSVVTSAGRVDCDSLVLATGTSFRAPSFRGSHKPGVFTLDSAQAYAELGRISGSLGSIVVAGEGTRALEVAERMSGNGKDVRVLISRWQGGAHSLAAFQVLEDAALERGVTVSLAELSGAVGTGRVEAVVADGVVSCCDSVVFVPQRTPMAIPTTARIGPSGGVLVDRNLRTSDSRVFAAGGCAEQGSAYPNATLETEPSMTGRIAGSNCLGGARSLGPWASTGSLVFGLRWVRTSPRGFSPNQASVVSWRWSRRCACEIRYDASSRRILGVELVQPATSPHGFELAVLPTTDLEDLAYGGAGSSDISVISETARLGLAQCQRS